MKGILLVFLACLTLTSSYALEITPELFTFYKSFDGDYSLIEDATKIKPNQVCPSGLSIKYSIDWYFATGKPVLNITGINQNEEVLRYKVDSINAVDDAGIERLISVATNNNRKEIEIRITGCYSGRLCWPYLGIAQSTNSTTTQLQLKIEAKKDSQNYVFDCIYKANISKLVN